MDLRVSKKKGAIALLAVALILMLVWQLSDRASDESTVPDVSIYGTYTTNFASAESPLSEGGKWINGKTNGLKWADVKTSPGLVFGTQAGNGGYDDSTAVLAGTWGPSQTVTATIRTTNPTSSPTVFQEVELRLRTTITANSLTGYEVNFSCSENPKNFYAEIVRWNGAFGDFSYVKKTKYHVVNGDIVKATIRGKTIKVFVNDAMIMEATDRTFSTGNPGLGFFLAGVESNANPNFGFSTFTATDETIPH